MPYEIIWSPTARKNYFSILGYLHDNWTRKELNAFVKKTISNLDLIADNPRLFQYSPESNTFRCLVVKQVSLYYRLKGETIELLTFWDNRQDPSSLKL